MARARIGMAAAGTASRRRDGSEQQEEGGGDGDGDGGSEPAAPAAAAAVAVAAFVAGRLADAHTVRDLLDAEGGTAPIVDERARSRREFGRHDCWKGRGNRKRRELE